MRPPANLRSAIIGAAMSVLASTIARATPIDDKYAQLGGATGFLGAPTIAESTAPDGIGKYRHYAVGSIYWHPSTGAHVVYGLILQRWRELGAERGYLGYPMTDEIATFDGGGRVTKFQGGELIWRPATNKVSDVKSTDLIIDWPFPAGQPWLIIQANAFASGWSHAGPWVYCWDIILAGKSQAASDGMPFLSVADGRIVHVDEKFPQGTKDGNVIVQRLGAGRYASYLHIKQSSYARRFTAGRGRLPQDLPWSDRPMAKSGTVLGEVGDTGAAVGAHHMHFCVTTKPDRAQFAPFESVPVAFRNYSASSDKGKTWTFTQVGVPKKDQWVRREKRPGPSAPQVNDAAAVINFGTVKGQIVPMPGGKAGAAGGKLIVRVDSEWGEPLASRTVAVAGDSAGPWPYEIAEVPAFNDLKLTISYEGAWSTADRVVGDSAPFELKSSATVSVNLQLKTAGAK